MRTVALLLGVVGGVFVFATMLFAFTLSLDYVRLADGYKVWAAARLMIAALIGLAGVGGAVLVLSRTAVGGIVMLASAAGAWVVCLIGEGTAGGELMMAGIGLIYASPFLIAGGIIGVVLALILGKSSRMEDS